MLKMNAARFLPGIAGALVAAAIDAGTLRFGINESGLWARLRSHDAAAWNAFRAALGIDIARLLGLLDPFIEAVYLCLPPRHPAGPILLIARVSRPTPALSIVVQELTRALRLELSVHGTELSDELVRLQTVDSAAATGPRGATCVNEGARAVPVPVWIRRSGEEAGGGNRDAVHAAAAGGS